MLLGDGYLVHRASPPKDFDSEADEVQNLFGSSPNCGYRAADGPEEIRLGNSSVFIQTHMDSIAPSNLENIHNLSLESQYQSLFRSPADVGNYNHEMYPIPNHV
jgi:hypothetical protein